LKHSYNELLKEKTVQAEQAQRLTEENVRVRRDLERMQWEVVRVRVRSEARKLVEVQVFNNKKLEETLIENEHLIQIMKIRFEDSGEGEDNSGCGNREGKVTTEGKVV
jgi:hypothetical protein